MTILHEPKMKGLGKCGLLVIPVLLLFLAQGLSLNTEENEIIPASPIVEEEEWGFLEDPPIVYFQPRHIHIAYGSKF